MPRIHRYLDARTLSAEVAAALARRVASLQDKVGRVQLAISGGTTLNAIFESFSGLAETSALDASELEIWWTNERYVPSTDADRNSTQALSALARSVSIVPAQTHPMPTPSVVSDVSQAAAAYAVELGEKQFDICILALGPEGHIADIYPGNETVLTSTATALGITDAPHEPRERITLTLSALKRAKEVWVVASGYARADALKSTLAGDLSLPSAHLLDHPATHWFVDLRAASKLDCYMCRLVR